MPATGIFADIDRGAGDYWPGITAGENNVGADISLARQP